MLPNLIDDSDLDPYAVRLLLHYYRVTNNGKGACWESTRTTADHCHMGVGTVVKKRKLLAGKGWIGLAGNEEQNDTINVTVVDRWLENVEYYTRIYEGDKTDDPRRSPGEHPSEERSPGEHRVHQVNAGVHLVTSKKKDPKKKDPKKKRGEADPMLAAMVNALIDVTGMAGDLNWNRLAPAAGDLLDAGYRPEQILAHYSPDASGNHRWNWYRNDWRGKKDEMPGLPAIKATIRGAINFRPPARAGDHDPGDPDEPDDIFAKIVQGMTWEEARSATNRNE